MAFFSPSQQPAEWSRHLEGLFFFFFSPLAQKTDGGVEYESGRTRRVKAETRHGAKAYDPVVDLFVQLLVTSAGENAIADTSEDMRFFFPKGDVDPQSSQRGSLVLTCPGCKETPRKRKRKERDLVLCS